MTQSETTYAPCGCSPLGKLASQSVPHAYGTPANASTVYSYDGIGRTYIKYTAGPDAGNYTVYNYYNAWVQVLDAGGSWKAYLTDGFGNLVLVEEPDPGGAADYSWYSYDPLGHLTGVSMARPTGTQTRTFVYSGNFLMSATNPENGTVTYAYNNAYSKVSSRTDAKGQVTAYTYDGYARLITVQRYPSGTNNPEDACQHEDYFYDGNNPLGSNYPQYAAGHLSAVRYWGGYTPGQGCDTTFVELYTYGVPGAPLGKQLYVARGSATLTLTATFAYDTEGRMTQEAYPTDSYGATANLSYTFDSMGRLNTMTDNIASQTIIQGTNYGPANEILSITGGSYSNAWGGETRSYNSIKQLTGIGAKSYSYPYWNIGKISSESDAASGETVTYTYDSLNRLATADNGSTWGQSFSYDGFGNLTNVSVIRGSAPTLTASYDSNNHAGGEDANGNPGTVPLPASGSSGSATYDVENRLVAITQSYVPVMVYSYAPGNKRVWRGNWTNSDGTWTRGATDELTFWSVSGQKLTTYQLYVSGSTIYATQTGANLYFGGKLIKNANGWVNPDRLGSIGKFYPYGGERPSATTNGTEKFTGYFRDAESGNDYAVNRYMSPGWGRFLTPDPSLNTNALTLPGNWNRYAYVGGDPINKTDPLGLCSPDDDPPCYSTTVTGIDGDVCTDGNRASDCVGFDDDGGDGGGGSGPGGGGASAVQVTARFPVNSKYPATETQDVTNGLNAALQYLMNPKCASLFEPGGDPEANVVAAQNVLANTIFNIIKLKGDVGAQPGPPGTVFLNANGPFFKAGTNANGTVTVNLPNGQGRMAPVSFSSLTTLDAFLLLHELGHETGVFGPDAKNPGLNGQYSKDVLTDCLTQNAQGVWQ